MGWPSLSGIADSVSNGFNSARNAINDGVDAVSSTVSNGANAVRSTVSRGVTEARKAYAAVSSDVQDFSRRAQARASDLGQKGLDIGRRGLDAAQRGDVRGVASAAREGIGLATEASKSAMSAGADLQRRTVSHLADGARNTVNGDDLASRAFRGLVTGAEQNYRFMSGVTEGVGGELISTVGAIGQLGVTATEMQYSAEARVEYGTAIVNGIGDAAQAADGYVQSVVNDPSRLISDSQSVGDSIGGFVTGTVDRYGKALAEGRPEEIGRDVGVIATYVVPIGGGPARGAATAAVRSATNVAVREGGEALVRTGGEALARTGSEALARTGANAAEQRGAALVERIVQNGGAAPLENGAGRVADIAAAARQSGREVAVYRDAATGQRMVTIGEAGSVSVPAGNSRIIAHTQPGAGPASLTPSAADLTGLGQLGQRSSGIIDDAGSLSRFSIDDIALRNTPRAGADDLVRFEAPKGGSGTVTLYRVDDAAFSPRIAADATVPVVTTRSGGERALFVNIGQPQRAAEFALVNRGGNATITAVEVDASLLQKLRNDAVLETSEAARLNSSTPLKVDVTKAPDQFGLRSAEHIQMLREAIVPGTARIVDPSTLVK